MAINPRSRPEIGLYHAARQKSKRHKKYKTKTSLPGGSGDSITKRTEALLKMGFPSYAEYLNSEIWKRLRVKAFIINGHHCVVCAKRADVIHHLNYSLATLTGNCIQALQPVCNSCHKKIEFTVDGLKRTVIEAQNQFAMMLGKPRRG